MKSRKGRVYLWILGGLTLVTLLWISSLVCFSGYLRYGFWTDRCPVGTPVAGVEVAAHGLRRGSAGVVEVSVPISYSTGPADMARRAYTSRFDVELSLMRGDERTALTPKEGWSEYGSDQRAEFTLPEGLEDGDYRLRADVDTPLGPVQHEVKLPVYAPARLHTLTDRPLYEPGNTVRFRALVLRARDLSPLDNRPGVFKVTDPTGEVVMELAAPTGPFGVADGDFPLDDAAPTGVWWVAYESGGETDSVSVRVEPFTLPRFSVEAAPAAPFYTAGDRPVVKGRVVYSSGAPVSGARMDLRWSSSGAWPPPTAWMQGALPKAAFAEDDGRFELRLPRVPSDLTGQAWLTARIDAVDPAGDRVSGSARVLLSKDRLAASAVTELDGGLVPGFNNRIYLRVTTADGRPLPTTDLRVRRAWDPTDEGRPAKTDVDGVAALQIDPGPAVNVLIPAPPVRPPPRPDPVRRGASRELISGGEPSLADQVALDLQQARLAPCARFVEDGSEDVQVGLRVTASGRVEAATHERGALARCVGAVAKGLAFPAGKDRLFELEWTLTEDLPSLSLSFEGTPVVPDAARAALSAAALDARRCLPEDVSSGALGAKLLWALEPGSPRLELRVVNTPGTRGPLSAAAARCVKDRLQSARLDEPFGKGAQRAFGVASVSVQRGPRYEASSRPDTTKLGYELEISAAAGDEDLGKTKLFLPPGSVPDVRVRATPVLAQAGQEVSLKVLRGPQFSGTLPKKIYWQHDGTSHEMKLDKESRTASFTVPEGAQGWFEITVRQARALVFVRPAAELTVAVTADREVYPPGAQAKLSIETKAGGAGTKAAVGLFGVDQTLAQLAPLPGPDALSRLKVAPQMRSMAFGALDAQALTQGRVQGAAAAAAVVARVRSIPAPEDLDRRVSVSGGTAFDPVEALTDGFYRVLGGLYEQVRAWETSAPKDEVMRPATMARLWTAATAAAQKQGVRVEDAYGRPLRLSVLPDDLLSLVDPHAVVVDGTRLPEDVDNWIAWVREEQP